MTDQLTHQPTGLGSREERFPCGSGLGTLTDYSSKNKSNIQHVCLKDGLAKKVSSHSHFSPSFKGDCRAVSKFKKNYFWNWNTIKALSQDMSWLWKIYWIIACNEVKFWDLQIWNTKKLYPKKCHGFAKYTESSRLTKWTVSIWFWARSEEHYEVWSSSKFGIFLLSGGGMDRRWWLLTFGVQLARYILTWFTQNPRAATSIELLGRKTSVDTTTIMPSTRCTHSSMTINVFLQMFRSTADKDIDMRR